jgi:hypothetical protein
MNLYTIHLRRLGLDIDRDVAVVKEGFSWPAFFLTFLWASWCRLWLVAAVYIIVQSAMLLFFYGFSLDPLSQGIFSLGLAVVFGYVANDFQQQKLSTEGFALCAVLNAKNAEQAYRQFFEKRHIKKSNLNK